MMTVAAMLLGTTAAEARARTLPPPRSAREACTRSLSAYWSLPGNRYVNQKNGIANCVQAYERTCKVVEKDAEEAIRLQSRNLVDKGRISECVRVGLASKSLAQKFGASRSGEGDVKKEYGTRKKILTRSARHSKVHAIKRGHTKRTGR